MDNIFKRMNYKNISRIVAPAVIGAFFCFLCFYYGVREYPDSITYIEHFTEREPVYVLFLQFMRFVFSDAYYKFAVCVAQNVFAGIVSWKLYKTIGEHYCFGAVWKSVLLTIILMPHLLSGVVSSSKMVLTNAILSEGITYSIYQLFIVYVLELMWTRNKTSEIKSLIVAFIASITRGQLMPLILVYMIVEGIVLIRNRFWDKITIKKTIIQIIVLIASVIICFVARGVCNKLYNYFENGQYISTTSGGKTILTNVMYSSNDEDLENIRRVLSEKEFTYLQQVLFDMKSEKIGYRDVEEFGGLTKIFHHEDSHDAIKFGRLDRFLRRLAETELYGYDYDQIVAGEVADFQYPNPAEVDSKVDEIALRYAKLLLQTSYGQFINTYVYVAIGGFIRTVGLLRREFIIPAMIMYILLFIGCLTLYIIASRDKRRNGEDHVRIRGTADIIALALLLTCSNVLATSLTIMCLSRYMIYTTGIMYIALMCGIYELIKLISKKRRLKDEN